MGFELRFGVQIDKIDNPVLKEIVELDYYGIEDPWHSRPLDVHRMSDHPEISAIESLIWDRYLENEPLKENGGKRLKWKARRLLRVLILDLYIAWMEDPTLCIGVAMSTNSWDARSRYNALHIPRKITEVVHGLHEVGLILLARGSYGGPWGLGNRTTRIRPAQPLIEVFRGINVPREAIGEAEERECIILRGNDSEESKLVEYKDTPETIRMREELKEYNSLISNTYIDIPILDDPWIIRGMDRRGRETKVPVDPYHQSARRVFNRSDWSCGGRFYGPWWQQIGSTWREKICINDTPTVEVDFKGMHVAILAAQAGVGIPQDAYALPPGVIEGTTVEEQRKIIKKLILVALNAKSRKTAFNSFREDWPAGHKAKTLTNAELEEVLRVYIEHYPFMEEHLGADKGIRLMNLDSQIIALVQRELTERNIPVLTVHDSAIIDYTHVGLLKQVMTEASMKVVGVPLPLEAKYLGVDEIEAEGFAELGEIHWKQPERSPGYLKRLEAWEKRKGHKVVRYH